MLQVGGLAQQVGAEYASGPLRIGLRGSLGEGGGLPLARPSCLVEFGPQSGILRQQGVDPTLSNVPSARQRLSLSWTDFHLP